MSENENKIPPANHRRIPPESPTAPRPDVRSGLIIKDVSRPTPPPPRPPKK